MTDANNIILPGADLPDTNHQFVMGITEDRRVLLAFGRPIDHLILTHEQTEELLQGLSETLREARSYTSDPTGRRFVVEP